jgi:hypothetical protein
MRKPERRRPDEKVPKTGRTIGDFWAWAYSDLLTNIPRAVFAEWLVGSALDADHGIRPSWEPYDLDHAGAKIEVKSSSYVQGWAQEKETQPDFDIARKTAEELQSDGTWVYDPTPRRRADVYVFCLYAERVPKRADALDIGSWEFYVLSTPTIEERFGDQKKVRLSRIKEIEKTPVGYDNLRRRVDRALNGHGYSDQ